MTQGRRNLWVALAVAALMVVSSSLVIGGAIAPLTQATAASITPSPAPAANSASISAAPTHEGLGVDSARAATVQADEQALAANGYSSSQFLPPNLHQAPPMSQTAGVVTPLYSVAPAPTGVAYYGLNDTNGQVVASTVNTTSLQATFSTSDPIGVQTEGFDFGTQTAYGAQLNAVLTNVTLFGQTSFPANPNAPTGCTIGTGNAPNCPNEFWLQNVIGYNTATHVLSFENNIWNFSNPSGAWSSGTNAVQGFSTPRGGFYAVGGPSITISYPFTLALYLNTTRGPCHLDTTPGSGVPSCGTVSTTAPVNEVFFNYTVWNSLGQKVCPGSPGTGKVCGEYDDVFFNSVSPSVNPLGVPEYGPSGRIGSATIQANGSSYDPLGLTNDYEMDWGIGSSSGATTNVVYADATVGINYCTSADTTPTGSCTAYSTPPAAYDYGGETGETNTGALSFWAPQATAGGAPLYVATGTPVAHFVMGPSLLLGLWNATGGPYPAGSGAYPLNFASISPANAWVGIAPGTNQTNQSLFQVAPTFGWYSGWSGSGGAPTPTTLGQNLYLPPGLYTVEVLLSGYNPYIGNVDLRTSGQTPVISLTHNLGTGVYTPLWAYSSSDLANISLNYGGFGLGSPGNPYLLQNAAPTVGAPFGVSGSVSWLFSNLNDYLFTTWIGEYINATASYAESNPGPSFLMDYPSWQVPTLLFFGVPTTDQFQFYFYHTQNFTLAGTSHIYAWANSQATTLYSVVCNACHNDLIADNAFAVSDRGLEFINGGGTLPLGNALLNTRNVVWGNTFVPDPQPAFPGLISPSTGLVASESFDRIFNNEFYTNGTATSSGTNSNFWNVTCQSGYAPLTQSSYPGSIVCQPGSFVTSYLGFALTGSIIGTAYQGGNFWFNYGNAANPFANIPYVARSSSISSSAGIAASANPYRGDYAPLISYTVYDPNFAETGLPISGTGTTSATAFQVRVVNATGYGWLNDTQTAVPTALCSGNPCVVFYLPSGSYTYTGLSGLTGTLASAANPATGSFSISGAPVGLVTTFAFGLSHAVTFTETGLPSGTHWSVSITGQTTLTSTTSSIVFNLANGGYLYTVAGVTGYLTTNPSGTVTVSGAAVPVSVPFYPLLTPAGAPSVSAPALDVDQALLVTGTIPTTGVPSYAWQWLVSVNGGSYASATQCAANSGSGASAGATESCSVTGGTLTIGDTYAFEMQVTDSASESQTSIASPTVTVASALTAPAAPAVSATTLDTDQVLSVTGTIPSTGTSSYAWTWLNSVNGGSYATATLCSTNGGVGAAAGAPETCSVPSGSLAGGDTYAFELQVADSATSPETQTSTGSATVTVAPALTAPGAPVVSATALDGDQALTVTGTIPSTGTPSYAWTWLVSVNGGSFAAATQCAVDGGTGASGGAIVTCAISGGTLVTGDYYAFELQVTDGASSGETQTSSASSTVTVATSLTSPAAPSVSATSLDVDQALTATGTIPSTGTAPYAWSWLVSVNGGSFSSASLCATNGGAGAGALATGDLLGHRRLVDGREQLRIRASGHGQCDHDRDRHLDDLTYGDGIIGAHGARGPVGGRDIVGRRPDPRRDGLGPLHGDVAGQLDVAGVGERRLVRHRDPVHRQQRHGVRPVRLLDPRVVRSLPATCTPSSCRSRTARPPRRRRPPARHPW